MLADTIHIVQAGAGRFTRRVKIQNSTSLLEQERHGGGWVGGGGGVALLHKISPEHVEKHKFLNANRNNMYAGFHRL